MSRPKYPNRITVSMTDDLFQTIKSDLGLRHMLGDLGKDDCTILLLNIIKAIDENESGPIFLRSIKEAEREKK